MIRNRTYRLTLFLATVLLWSSCTKEMSVDVPTVAHSRLAAASPLSASQRRALNGVYAVESGTDRLGKWAVVQLTGTTISIYTGKNAGLFVLKNGIVDSAVVMEGYWRYTQSSETGTAWLEIQRDSISRALLRGEHSPGPIMISGMLADGSSDPSIPVRLRYDRPLKDTAFAVIAHRGGGRNSDRLPASENSLGMIAIAQQFGANGIEIDVRMTKDGVPILFHDENFSPRLVNTDYLVGPVSNFTFAAIRTLGTLKNGERVPTLREALQTVVDGTGLATVWLDIKSSDALRPAAQLAAEFQRRADSLGRPLTIYLGLATEELVERYQREGLTAGANVNILCEVSVDAVRSVNARVWAPRWTLGPMRAQAEQLRAEGRRTIVWTLDQREFITPFFTENAVDGILTNYPALVAFEYHVLP
jgi:glycerophosphoryl diester phosphodiesterase